MRLDEEQESQNIEDRRGRRVSRGIAGGGIGTLVIILLALFFGIDPRMLLQGNVAGNKLAPGSGATVSTTRWGGRDAPVRR